ncbi:MAG TPA: ergothioneine biosynthesis protein EgtB [Gammaproteobacteria bacterium]|nr:ergothioneine biosynthesis protein EgtB [Gammaproteobacteria bacterium]
MNTLSVPHSTAAANSLLDRYRAVRALTVDLCHTLAPEDMMVQSMPDASPAKWHLAHTTWFFETFILVPYAKGYRPFHPQYAYLFNSYYYSAGRMYPRPERGLLSRPTVADIFSYRDCVNDHMQRLLDQNKGDAQFEFLVTLGLNHEQQHQELLLTDLKHLFSLNPLKPVWRDLPAPPRHAAPALKFMARPEGLSQIGHAGNGFAYDNETPRHRVFLKAHAIANRPVTTGEYREFIRAGGYSKPELWLSDGWATVQRDGWQRPLYWNEDLSAEFTLGGEHELDLNAPVCHVSYYEADAFARWTGARLPTEAEWEAFAAEQPVSGNFLDSGLFHPAASGAPHIYGDVWQWTSSAYAPYPGYQPLAGTLGEYNGKFMANQLVLRGGSCVTPAGHMRASYRNFFYPHQRWQFMGLRLAKDN